MITSLLKTLWSFVTIIVSFVLFMFLIEAVLTSEWGMMAVVLSLYFVIIGPHVYYKFLEDS